MVERDPALAWLYQEELREAGFRVRVCSTLSTALTILRTQPVHLLVTDLASVGDEPRAWLPRLRRVFSGPVVGLCSRRRRGRAGPGFSLVPKSSDLTPLISSVYRHTLWARWSAAAGTC